VVVFGCLAAVISKSAAKRLLSAAYWLFGCQMTENATFGAALMLWNLH